ncbi:MAG: MBL fold metallo-hydrolase [Pseudomonadota bacterium]
MLATTRRNVLLSSPAAALGMMAPLHLLSNTPAADPRGLGYFRYRIGDVTFTALYDGIWQKEHDEGFIQNATVGETMNALAKAGLASDHVPIEFAPTLIEVGGKRILIDPGTGGQWVPTAGDMPRYLRAAGVGAGSIDTILISHFHPDHIFGLMEKETDAQLFPDSEILVPEDEYTFWTDAGVFSKLPDAWHGLARRIQATFPSWRNVTRISTGQEVAPRIRGLPTPGHTPGHTAFHIDTGEREVIVAGDVAITPALFVAHPDWRITFDADPVLAQQTRRRLFDQVTADDAVIAGYHFGFPNAGSLRRNGSGYLFEPFAA